MKWFVIAVALLAGCAPVAPRFPTDVQTAVAHDDMRKLVTERFIIYYPAARRALVDRFLARADGCAKTLREHALIKKTDKIVIVMPDEPFNNAFVAPSALGYEEISVIPTHSTLDFTTAFGLPPDPGAIACHELTHYVHFEQNAGFWGTFNDWFGPMYSPQLGYDPWFDEGIATHYEARLSPGLGRPVWPLFTGMFAAAYAGRSINSGELSAFGREAPVGHHYLVGSMFVRFLVEKYGERPLWTTIENEAHAFTGWFFTGTFKHGFAVSFSDLFDQFGRWVNETFPARQRPPTQRKLTVIGNDARYARGRDGTEAWVAEEVDSPPRLTVRDARGKTLFETPIVKVLPPRTIAIGDPLLTSGLSITADGSQVWLTVIDLGPTYQVTRLLRWTRDGDLTEVATNLGPGATIDPMGSTYYYAAVDGDRWSLAAYDVKTGARRMVVDMKPGTYVVGAQVSSDGKQLAASVWNGTAFVIWIVDAQTGAIAREIKGNGTPVFDASFLADGRIMHLGVVAGRFQAFIDNAPITDAPYAVFAAREVGGTIRFLDREHWDWELAEVATPPKPAPPPPPAPAPEPATPAPDGAPTTDAPVPAPVPAGGQPATGQPATGQPATGQPATGQPATGQPATGQPATGQPATGQPATGQPATGQPATGQPATGQPATGQPQPTWLTSPPGAPSGQPPTGQGSPDMLAAPALYPSTPIPLPPPGSVPVLADESYSAFDHLFYPQVRSPTLLVSGVPPHLGLVLGGADRLELQRWMLAGYWQPGNDTHKSHYAAAAGYLNNMLAPVSLLAQGNFIDWRSQSVDDSDPMNTITYDEEHRTRDASAAIGYVYRGSLFTTLGGVYTDDFVQVEGMPSSRLHLGGPSASMEWYSAESTRYTGPRRALLANAAIAYYPQQWSTFMGNITDVTGTLGTTLPLPFGRRHTISAFARARSLLAPDDTNLLQVGGDSALGILWNRSNKMAPPDFDTSRFPPNLRFVEPLRGFEDFGIAAERVKLGEVSWKYPLIIDRGTAASLFVLPASFLRQLDLELFASGAIVDANDRHYAVGAATTLHIQFLRIPLVVMYQVARRLTDDEALTHLIAIGPDI